MKVKITDFATTALIVGFALLSQLGCNKDKEDTKNTSSTGNELTGSIAW